MNLDQEKMERICELLNFSPFYLHIGMRVENIAEGKSVLTLDASSNLTNIHGSIHGGGLASLIDSACGMALASRLDPEETAVTVDLNIHYLKPAFPGRLSASGSLVYRGSSIGFEEAEIHHENGELLARGSAVHLISKRTA